jgi:GT2 family glycosyltransferase
VLITSHNRVDKTLACLRSLADATVDADLRVVLVDADSQDGTQEKVAASFPETLVVPVGDDVFWGQGMRIAAQYARPDADYHLWLNDDVVLTDSALADLLHWGRHNTIVVGKLEDGAGMPTYGGLVAPRLARLSSRPIPVSDEPVLVDTMNGNIVLVGRTVRQAIGAVRGELFPHAFGDIDYGFRARHAGFDVIQAPGVLGYCSRNPPVASRSLPTLRGRWRAVVSMKELPPSMWRRACFRYGGILAPAYFVWPYVRVLRPPSGAS